MMLAFPLSILVLAVALLRWGWSGDSRIAHLGWAIGIASLVWLGILEGAWGVAVGFTLAIAAAFVPLLHAAVVSPAKVRRRAKEPAIALGADRSAVGRRLAVFAMVVPASFVAALVFALGVNALMKGDGALEANSVATAFMLQPLVWAGLMTWQMCLPSVTRMARPPLLVAATGATLWVIA